MFKVWETQTTYYNLDDIEINNMYSDFLKYCKTNALNDECYENFTDFNPIEWIKDNNIDILCDEIEDNNNYDLFEYMKFVNLSKEEIIKKISVLEEKIIKYKTILYNKE